MFYLSTLLSFVTTNITRIVVDNVTRLFAQVSVFAVVCVYLSGYVCRVSVFFPFCFCVFVFTYVFVYIYRCTCHLCVSV